MQKLYNNNNLADHAGGIAGDINSAKNTAGFFGATAGQLAAPGYAEHLADQYGPNKRTYNEDFLLGGGATTGLDQLYSRLYDTGARKLDNAAAARGGFNTGAALRAQQELGADMNAQHVKDYMTASNQADASKNAYQRYGLDLTTAADNGLRGRISTGLTGANMVDNTALGRAKAGQDLYSGVSDELRNNLTTAGNWADSSQKDWLARLLGGAGAANDSNTQMLNRLAGKTTAANDESTQFLNRLNGGSDASKRAQDAADQRINTGIRSAKDTSDTWMNRIKGAAGLSVDEQNLILQRLMSGGNLAAGADNSDLQRLIGGQNAANSAQNDQQNRESTTFNNVNMLGNEQSGATERGQDKARDEQRMAVMDEINGLIAKGGINSQQIMAKYGAQMAALGLVIQGGKVVQSIVSPASAATGGLTGGGGRGPEPTARNPVNGIVDL